VTADRAAQEAAFARYLEVQPRLPAPAPLRRLREAETLREVAQDYDLVLLDAYGVLNVGEAPVPGAVECIARLRAAGTRVMVVSNSAGYPKPVMMARYARLGFDFAPQEVVSSREALLAHLASLPARRWGLMIGEAHPHDEFGTAVALGDDPAAYARVDGFLLIGADGWTDARQDLLEDALRAWPRPVLVGNPDLVAPREGGLSREPGHWAHRLADRTGIAPAFFGKPFPRIFELALARIGAPVASERVLMVGDTLHTDVLGGQQAKFATALMTGFGALSALDWRDAIRRSGITPDLVVARP
jgi:HAD superfamily hydrolase (TIGR01450 family)